MDHLHKSRLQDTIVNRRVPSKSLGKNIQITQQKLALMASKLIPSPKVMTNKIEELNKHLKKVQDENSKFLVKEAKERRDK